MIKRYLPATSNGNTRWRRKLPSEGRTYMYVSQVEVYVHVQGVDEAFRSLC